MSESGEAKASGSKETSENRPATPQSTPTHRAEDSDDESAEPALTLKEALESVLDNPDAPVDDSLFEKLSRFFKKSVKVKDEDTEKVLSEPTVDAVVEYIKSGKCKNIIVMVGAGISTSAGIPGRAKIKLGETNRFALDFRSPNTGLYANLQKYNLPSPEAMFHIGYFKSNPQPFFSLAKELYPGSFKPTPSHYFLRLLQDHGVLRRVYSQNIDMLERVSGISDDKIVEAHGSFHKSHCLSCRKEYQLAWMKEKIFADEIPRCEKCKGLVKPDIVFFGENLPTRFFELSGIDFDMCDLLIVMGTSLTVQPFASLVDNVPSHTPRLIINKTKFGKPSRVANLFGLSKGFDFDSESNFRDVMWQGLTDEKCIELAEKLGWADELKQLTAKGSTSSDEN